MQGDPVLAEVWLLCEGFTSPGKGAAEEVVDVVRPVLDCLQEVRAGGPDHDPTCLAHRTLHGALDGVVSRLPLSPWEREGGARHVEPLDQEGVLLVGGEEDGSTHRGRCGEWRGRRRVGGRD